MVSSTVDDTSTRNASTTVDPQFIGDDLGRSIALTVCVAMSSGAAGPAVDVSRDVAAARPAG
ncbi:hypothetical protein [Kineococcus rubinsiae]|uniref:hypothetical protein n=1 Tax=Kineococcus rubinsiae TaxID=2609562 RepID=UPI001AD9316B|nr:hypothetical protein [Kineococcus rubinsiae]